LANKTVDNDSSEMNINDFLIRCKLKKLKHGEC